MLIKMKSTNLKQLIFTISKYQFSTKAAPAKGGAPGGKPAGGAPAAPPVPEVIQKTALEQLVEAKGSEMILGPPYGTNKSYHGHRHAAIPKIAPRIEVYAKKLRDMYFREGVLPEYKTYLEANRLRQPEDTIERLIENKEIAAVIEARDEFEDVDLVFPWRVPY